LYREQFSRVQIMKRILIILAALALMTGVQAAPKKTKAKKTVYVSYILHGNMNYDRYVRPTIWKEFPVIYDNLLDFMDEHQDFSGQLQFSGQTISSLMQCAPEVVDHALAIHNRGQLNFTGTFYSEPVNVNMDGETNYRCCWLGTRIVEDIVGETDGFYLQERAYHPQLPWIFNHSKVSWTPVITGNDADVKPFKLIGMDGSESVCVPITRDRLLEKIAAAPKNSLFTIEEDYEIPQSFTSTYAKVAKFNEENNEGIEVKWITVKEYIKKFGLGESRYVDHSAKASNRDNGTYSRWTADPLDIVVQNATNKAMADFRAARIIDALVQDRLGVKSDVLLAESDINLIHDPLVWNIERAEIYPGIVEKYLSDDGKPTLLSNAENLLLWAVNSDAKGWFPLYEKRRERINSFENSSLLSNTVINTAMDALASELKVDGTCEKYYLVANMEAARTKAVELTSKTPVEVYDCADGSLIPSESVFASGQYVVNFKLDLPSYGYKTVGLRTISKASRDCWEDGTVITAEGVSVSSKGDKVELLLNGKKVTLSMDDFQIKALAQMREGKGDDQWRAAKEYGQARVSVRKGLKPQLRIERQLDWLLHLQQLFTIVDGKVFCDVSFVFPHPTLVRKEGEGDMFDPRGLSLIVDTFEKGLVHYDIPFGISSYDSKTTAYLCPLSTCFLQQESGGLVVSPQTGEQAFSCDADQGRMTLHLGASTVSGPIRDVDLEFEDKTTVNHELAWYLEPFHGQYDHRIVFYAYEGDWKDAHIPASIREVSSPVYFREFTPSAGSLPAQLSLLSIDKANVELTSAKCRDAVLSLRLNEREGLQTKTSVTIGDKTIQADLHSFGIEDLSE